jgi:hypothetical protein
LLATRSLDHLLTSSLARRGRPATEVAGQCRGETGPLPATLRPFEEFPPPAAVRCHHRLFCLLAVEPRRVVDAPRSPLLVGGSGVCPAEPSASRRCSANGSVASDTLSGAGSLVPSMGLCPLRGPTSSAASESFSRATRRHPKAPPSGRPWRRGESLRSSRGHPSHAVGRGRRGSLSGGVVRLRLAA